MLKSGQKVIISRQTVANFRQKRLQVLKISILTLNFVQMGTFSPKFCIFRCQFLEKKIFQKFFQQAKI